jgi:hypothetical protein
MAYPIPPLINGKSYEWADVALNIMGVSVVGIVAIEYGDDQDIQNIWGAGSDPISRGYGKREPMAKITLKMEEVESIMNVAPFGRLQDIPEFDVSVVFLDSALTTVKHKIRNCRFKNNKRNTKQGDTSIDVELDLIPSHIEWK